MKNEVNSIKEAFIKVKQDIDEIKEYISSLSQEIDELKQTILDLYNNNSQITQQLAQQNSKPRQIPAHLDLNQAVQHITPAHREIPTHNPTDKQPLYSLKRQNTIVSIGNEGVPTDRQTDRQTDQHIIKTNFNTKINHINKVSEILESLDEIKKDLRAKFKKLTAQEMLVFSAIYQLQDQGLIVDYTILAQKLNLSESSIRDYTQKIIRKGIPLEKNKENNKKIILSIPPELKKIASLQTLISLREL